jgi:hypothetical protein
LREALDATSAETAALGVVTPAAWVRSALAAGETRSPDQVVAAGET